MADVSPTPECPCGAKLSEEQKSVVNWGRENSPFQNPMASQIGGAQGAIAANSAKVTGILSALGGSTDQITKLTSTIQNSKTTIDTFSDESNRLSGLKNNSTGPDLLSLISTVGAAVNFQCALGIDGLDVGGGIGLMNEKGKMQLNTAINVNLDLTKLLNKIDLGDSPSGIQKQLDSIAADLSKVTDAMNDIAGKINAAIAEVNGMYDDALNFVTQFTNINFALNFSNAKV